MANTRITKRFCDAIVLPVAGSFTIKDLCVRGLELRVFSSGTKSWSIRYRSVEQKQSRMTLGTYPMLSPSQARVQASKALAEIGVGRNLGREKREDEECVSIRSFRTFDLLAEGYFSACERGEWQPKGKPQRPRTIADGRACHRRYVQPAIGSLPLELIKRSTIKGLLRGMLTKGIEAQTKRTHAFVRGVFAWAMSEFEDEPVINYNPASGIMPMGRVRPRSRVYSDDELRAVWSALDSVEALSSPGGTERVGVSRSMALIIQLCAVVLQRRSEVAGMHERELDLAHRTWLIPGERTKSGWPQLVPLSPLAISLIEEAKRLRGESDSSSNTPWSDQPGPLFPARNDCMASVRGHSVTYALRRVRTAIGLSDLNVHDLRRTGSTIMTSERLGISPFIRSKVLGHRADTGGGALVSMLHYDANEYVVEKRRALEAWAKLLDEIVAPGC
jgi:integrase